MAVVVLGTAIDVVERLGVVDRHFVILRERQVADVTPGLAEVVGLVNAAIDANQQVVLVVRVKRHRVMIGMLAVVTQVDEVLATVVGDVHLHVHLVHTIKLVRARENLLVVMRSGAAGEVLVFLLPGLTAVGRAPEAALAVRQLDRRVDYVRMLRRDRDAGLAPVLLGQSFCQLPPGLAAIL